MKYLFIILSLLLTTGCASVQRKADNRNVVKQQKNVRKAFGENHHGPRRWKRQGRHF